MIQAFAYVLSDDAMHAKMGGLCYAHAHGMSAATHTIGI